MKKRILSAVIVLIITATSILWIRHSTPPKLHALSGDTQGTTYHIQYWLPPNLETSETQPAFLQKQITETLQHIDQQLSTYRPDSDLERFNNKRNTTQHTVPKTLVRLIERARVVSKASHGCYDVTIKPFFDAWGFNQNQPHIPTTDRINTLLKTTGMQQLESSAPNQLRKKNARVHVDLSSIGQGYGVQRLSRLLEQRGIQDYLVEIGGELRVHGKKPSGEAWRVAIEKPLPDARKIEKIIAITGDKPLAVMTSGTYRHFFDANATRYSHILDGRTGRPVTHNTVSVTVFDTNATSADAWSTALLCLGTNEGVQVANQHGIAALFIDETIDETIDEKESSPATEAMAEKEPGLAETLSQPLRALTDTHQLQWIK